MIEELLAARTAHRLDRRRCGRPWEATGQCQRKVGVLGDLGFEEGWRLHTIMHGHPTRGR